MKTKGKFWAVVDMNSNQLTFCHDEVEASSLAMSLARSSPQTQFIIVESHYGFIVPTAVPVSRVSAEDALYGEIEF